MNGKVCVSTFGASGSPDGSGQLVVYGLLTLIADGNYTLTIEAPAWEARALKRGHCRFRFGKALAQGCRSEIHRVSDRRGLECIV